MKIMSALTSTEVAPKCERIITNWRRFSSGLWRASAGDIAAAYSVSMLPKVQTFTHEGRLFTNGGSCFTKCIHAEVQGYPLIPADEYRSAESVPYSYQGREVTCKEKVFRLGEQVIFVASDPTIEEWRSLLRSLYADGGLFAVDCTYAGFILDRFDPKSENGNAARFKELAECGAQQMPSTQEEMCCLLAHEKGFANQPQQIDFAL
jgi:hypothetical protein